MISEIEDFEDQYKALHSFLQKKSIKNVLMIQRFFQCRFLSLGERIELRKNGIE